MGVLISSSLKKLIGVVEGQTKILARLVELLEENRPEYFTEHEFLTLTAGTTAETSVKFDKPVKRLWLITDQDIYVDFDRKADAGSGFLLTSTEGFKELKLRVSRISGIASSTTATVKIIGLR